MQRFTLDRVYKEEIRQAYFTASSDAHRHKIIAQALKRTGYSYGGLMKALKLSLRQRPLGVNEKLRVDRINEYGRLVWAFQKEKSTGRNISTRVAIDHLKASGALPESVNYFQISEAIRRQKLKNKSGVHFKRFTRSVPLSMAQVDFTRSVYLSHVRRNGSSYLRVTDPKPGKSKQDRVWIAVIIDDATRVIYARYYLAKGESAALAQQFVLKAFSRKGRLDRETGELVPLPLFQGLPKQLYTDRGSAFRNASFSNGLLKLGIKHIIGTNSTDTAGNRLKDSNKQARGKVERMIRYIKDHFETTIFLNNKGKEFTIKEINRMFRSWLIIVNKSDHPELGSQLRWELFKPALETMEGLPKEAETLFSNSLFRKVVRRQVRISSGIYCKVPPEISSGAKIEIITIGENYYTMIGDKRVLLEVLSQHVTEQPVKKAVKEFESDYLEGITLRVRLNDEIEHITRQQENIGTLSKNFADLIKTFIAEKRSVKEVKEFSILLLSRTTSSSYAIDSEGELVSVHQSK